MCTLKVHFIKYKTEYQSTNPEQLLTVHMHTTTLQEYKYFQVKALHVVWHDASVNICILLMCRLKWLSERINIFCFVWAVIFGLWDVNAIWRQCWQSRSNGSCFLWRSNVKSWLTCVCWAKHTEHHDCCLLNIGELMNVDITPKLCRPLRTKLLWHGYGWLDVNRFEYEFLLIDCRDRLLCLWQIFLPHLQW